MSCFGFGFLRHTTSCIRAVAYNSYAFPHLTYRDVGNASEFHGEIHALAVIEGKKN